MTLDPRTPVLVGSAVAHQRFDDPRDGRDVIGLMAAAAEGAAGDAGAPELLRRAALVLVPQGSWRYHDAGRVLADLVGAADARTLFARLGVLQTTLFLHAARAIAEDGVDVALVVGGEAKWRDLRAQRSSVTAPATPDTEAEPDQTLAPEHPIISRPEIEAGLVAPVSQYALLEHARRHADHQAPDEHARGVAALWADFSAVAVANPDAWNRQPVRAEEIATPGPGNRPLALPYNKWHVSQWNVDQAGAHFLCSVSAARALGIGEDRWVFPHAVSESNLMLPVSERARLDDCPGFALAGRDAFALAGSGPDEVAHVDLYSCFPIAVRAQARELGLAPDRPLTLTGGMTFGGGPLNNYALQSLAAMTRTLRDDPGGLGLVTAVSGMLTKQGVSVWGARPPAAGFRSSDVTDEVDGVTERRTIVPAEAGPATLASYTVLAGEGGARRAVALADLAGSRRAVVSSAHDDVVAALSEGEWCGRSVTLDDTGGFVPA
jgi:acetyl-CoA C-acetyltransferase